MLLIRPFDRVNDRLIDGKITLLSDDQEFWGDSRSLTMNHTPTSITAGNMAAY